MYTVAGTTRSLSGQTKVRFSNDMDFRLKQLAKNGDTNVNLVELPHSMSKVDACEVLLNDPRFQNDDAVSAIHGYLTRNAMAEAVSRGLIADPSVSTTTTVEVTEDGGATVSVAVESEQDVTVDGENVPA